jgi:hypothetical protein
MPPEVPLASGVTSAQTARSNLTPQSALFIIELRLGVFLWATNVCARG